MIRGVIHQKDRAIINTYASNIRACKHIKQILTDLKKEIHNNATGFKYFTFNNG